MRANLGKLVFLFFSSAIQIVSAQNLVINPILKFPDMRGRACYSFSIQSQKFTDALKPTDSSWHFPWSEYSHCHFLVSEIDNDSIYSQFEYEINAGQRDSNESKIIQGQLCKEVEIDDSIQFSFILKIRNFRTRYRKGTKLIIGLSTSPVNHNSIPDRSNDSVQIISEINLQDINEQLSKLHFSANTRIPVNYFFVRITSENKKAYNYFYLNNFSFLSKLTRGCNEFTY